MQKVFNIYENERWWLGRGWIKQLIPGERSAWSDLEGNLELKKESVNLPNGLSWVWTQPWVIEKTDKTDDDGW